MMSPRVFGGRLPVEYNEQSMSSIQGRANQTAIIGLVFEKTGEPTMAISTQKLEELLSSLQALKSRLDADVRAADAPLPENDPLLRMAEACEFPIPLTPTRQNLAEEVERKINNAMVLMQRARQHESLPEDARAAADQENSLMEQDYRDAAPR
jgi:hypothetical protein